MILDRHWWKTENGRLVPDGDPDARFLAYPRLMEIPDATARQLGILDDEPKSRAKPADKSRAKPADKAGT
jgi:hypothetical protein